ncbi:hypothetical protein BFP72_09025 [Reichenbachiella sp. 5M10]|uniref:copper resistance protein NlpE N-terminal domain-containing protein n=1 Tax=Reichenbachiella sp. 5M10 TaxID=1889772 RepID=UPI000C15A9DE|nr:copper resistance protein NlpE N-terminal domain-containing protein [Reichenbachiella sp. 5M10]PIB35522.1 hypothetical protein BFP72_09025 [Reichenbachiella sp. 5M10]
MRWKKGKVVFEWQWLLLLAVMLGCLPNKAEEGSDQSVDGLYVGVLPCADCPGVNTQLELREEGSYRLGRQYLGENKKWYWESGYWMIEREVEFNLLTLVAERQGLSTSGVWEC